MGKDTYLAYERAEALSKLRSHNVDFERIRQICNRVDCYRTLRDTGSRRDLGGSGDAEQFLYAQFAEIRGIVG